MKEKISKKYLSYLIKENVKEKAIHELFKEGLSLLSEVYAYPQTEYICFSEFPIGDGFADFVVFTGRSRMEVVVIEIKGADFRFSNSSSYRNMSFKINEAAHLSISHFWTWLESVFNVYDLPVKGGTIVGHDV